MIFNILLFNDFETLDIFGPVEIFGRDKSNVLNYYSMDGGVIRSAQQASVITEPVSQADAKQILVVPGGMGTRALVNDEGFLQRLGALAELSEYCLSVCTGSALLAKAGVLDGRRATSNKKSFSWVAGLSDRVFWQPSARWVKDGKFYTASGVSAGTDMALGFISDMCGKEVALSYARDIEYIWNSESDNDPFSCAP